LVAFEDAETTPPFRRLFILRPVSSSDEYSSESDDAGGGVAGRFRKFAFFPRFLNVTTGVATSVSASMVKNEAVQSAAALP
jgi:hypothetical protein